MNESRRMGFLALFGVALLGVLIARLWFLQVMEGQSFQAVASGNRTREIYTEAPRGRIFDAEGRVLAGRRESLAVVLDWTELRDLDDVGREEIFTSVAEELNRVGIKAKVSGLAGRFDSARNGSLKPVVVADDVGEEVWVAVQERDLPGFSVERRWIRTYPYGVIGAHIIGYTGTVPDSGRAVELNGTSPDKLYFAGDELGMAGVERLFESVLRGTPELRRVEVDAENRVIGTVEVLQAGIPGADVHLSIDIDYQYAAEIILADELRLARQRDACKGCLPHVGEAGSLVALDVTDGSVVAMASLPAFDPSDFIFGISTEQFAYLRDRPDQPFLDRSTQGLYPAGSTFKPVTSFAAVESGARGEFTPWNDEGRHTLANCTSVELRGCVFRNAGDVRLGVVDLRRALELSSDTYYYSLGELFWVQQETYGRTVIQDWAARFGFGAPTGIQLPTEQKGRLPTPENVEAELDADWFTGDNVNLAIGQGYLLVTPLQLTNAYAQLATGGTRYQPRLITRVTEGSPIGSIDDEEGDILQEFLPRIAEEEPLPPVSLAAIRDGLVAVNRSGTATAAFAGFPLDQYPIAGKTGTAQVYQQPDYALYAGFGPLPQAKYAVSAVLEKAGFGGDAAAPAVRRFFDILSGNTPVPAAPLAGRPGELIPRPDLPEGAGGSDVGAPTIDLDDLDSQDSDNDESDDGGDDPGSTATTAARTTTTTATDSPATTAPPPVSQPADSNPTETTTSVPPVAPAGPSTAQATAAQRRPRLVRFPR